MDKPGQERYRITGAGGQPPLWLPQNFRPARSSPPTPAAKIVRAYGYPDWLDLSLDDGYEGEDEAVIEVIGRIRAVTETALMSVLTDWRLQVRAAISFAREISPGVNRRTWTVRNGRLTFAHPDGLPSNFADVRIRVLKASADALDSLEPAG